MNVAKLNEWFALVANVGVLIGIAILIIEINQNTRAIETESVAQSTDSVMEVRNLIADNSDIWLKGCLGEEMSTEERIKYIQILEVWNFMYFSLWLRTNTIEFATSSAAGAQTVGLNIYRFDGLRDNWRELQSLSPNEAAGITSGWGEAVEEQYSRFADIQASKEIDISYCGR